MKRKNILILLILMCIISMNSTTIYAEKQFVQDSTNDAVIDSIQIDDNTQLVFELTESVEKPDFNIDQNYSVIASTSSLQTTSKKVSGRFYLVSNGQTVATYSLTASFSYDGLYCYCNNVTAASSAESGWIVTKNYGSAQVSPSYVRAYGSFDLFEVVNGQNVWNNQSSIRIFCDQNGTITYYHD